MPDSKIVLQSSRERSLVKGLTWETSGLLVLVLIALGVTHNIESSLQVGLAFFPLRLVMYFGHERIWKKVSWGHHEVVQRATRPGDQR